MAAEQHIYRDGCRKMVATEWAAKKPKNNIMAAEKVYAEMAAEKWLRQKRLQKKHQEEQLQMQQP